MGNIQHADQRDWLDGVQISRQKIQLERMCQLHTLLENPHFPRLRLVYIQLKEIGNWKAHSLALKKPFVLCRFSLRSIRWRLKHSTWWKSHSMVPSRRCDEWAPVALELLNNAATCQPNEYRQEDVSHLRFTKNVPFGLWNHVGDTVIVIVENQHSKH